MPQTNTASLYERLLTEPSPATNKDHYLFFLGTDTFYTPRPTAPEKTYYRGELFSYMAQAIAALHNEIEIPREKKPRDALAFSTPSVGLLNGPSLLGREVGDRIAEGLFLILQAAASGKESLQISGHSRGAVEAILTLHELARIKDELEQFPHKPLKQILINSPCPHTRAALEKLFTDDAEDSPEKSALLLSRLKALKTHGNFIDPVPGDLAGIGWHDPRFYLKLPCDKYEYYISRDERSSGFYPLTPVGTNVTVIPGHHGTTLGNLYTQTYADLPAEIQGKTSSVQDLVLCKLIYFMQQTTNIFNQPSVDQAPLNLGHEDLDRVMNGFLTADAPTRNQILLDRYLQVAKDDNAYRFFENTHYSYMLREYAAGNYRWVHFHNSGFTSAGDAFPDLHINDPIYTAVEIDDYVRVDRHDAAHKFVNMDNISLYLNKYLNTDQAKESDTRVVAITALLDNLLLEMRGNAPGELLTILSRHTESSVFFNALSILVGTISQQYLDDQLPDNEKASLLPLITFPFTMLAAAKDEEFSTDHQYILQMFESVLQKGIKQAIETHFNATLRQSDEILQRVTLFLNPENPQQKLREFLSTLEVNDDRLAAIKSRLMDLTPQTPAQLQQALVDEIEKIRQDHTLQPAEKERLLDTLCSSKQYSKLQTYLNAKQCSVEQYLSDIEKLHNTLAWIDQNYPQLKKELMGEETLEIDLDKRREKGHNLVQSAGAILTHTRYDLSRKPEHVSADFFAHVISHIPARGATGVLYAGARFIGSLFYHPSPGHSNKPQDDNSPKPK